MTDALCGRSSSLTVWSVCRLCGYLRRVSKREPWRRHIRDGVALVKPQRPTFVIRAALIRFNPRQGEDTALHAFADGSTKITGVVTLTSDWERDDVTADVTGCMFDRDDSLPPGSWVVAPLPTEETQ